MMEMATGCYQIRHCHVEVVAVLTNTVSIGPYRGAGRPEAVLNIERLIDKAARDLGMTGWTSGAKILSGRSSSRTARA